MKKKERQLLSNTVMEYVMDLGMTPYYTIFLANMILEKIEHPTMKTDELVVEVNQIMPEKYKRGCIQVSMQKSIENLEAALHDSDEIYKIHEEEGVDLFSGLIVKNTVKYFVNKVLESY